MLTKVHICKSKNMLFEMACKIIVGHNVILLNVCVINAFSSKTYPELFPFIDVCIKMMERVYKVQVQVAEPLAATTAATAAISSMTEHMEVCI